MSDIRQKNRSETFPSIGVVIIGINAEKYLRDCIKSVISADYDKDFLEIVYVDGGSVDNSPQIAGSFHNVKVLELRDFHPTPGRGRNRGWRSLSTDLIQFLDSDTILNPQWFRKAIHEVNADIAGVCGWRRESFPDRNAFHKFTDMEWHYETGPCRYFGGDVLIRRDVLEKTGGFDEYLIAGEDPELSYRIRQDGLRLLRIDVNMTTHDINMTTLRQYWRRAYRSGYAYAEIGLRFIGNSEKMWLRELSRIIVRAAVPPTLLAVMITIGKIPEGILMALSIIFLPLLRTGKIKRGSGESWKYSFLYAVHTSLVIYPQLCGILRYCLGRLTGVPLRNKGMR